MIFNIAMDVVGWALKHDSKLFVLALQVTLIARYVSVMVSE